MRAKKIIKGILLMLCVILLLSGCYSHKKYKYYSDKANYISVTGTVSFINPADEGFYLGFNKMSTKLSDNAFKIVGKNLAIVETNGIMEKLQMGDEVTFITAPKYFGDGYVMPIVAITVDGETLLEFEEGYNNLLDWLKDS